MNQRFDFVETSLSGLFRVNRKPIVDGRGYLNRLYCANEFKEIGLTKSIVQMNNTLTRFKGTVRGMHFQYPPHTEIKIITCTQGEIFDVAVDIRRGSPTFLQYHSEILSAENQASLYIPEGFAHGFQTLTDDCHLLYMHSAFYAPDSESALNAQDPMLAIGWPMEVTDISERDRNHPQLDSQFEGVVLP